MIKSIKNVTFLFLLFLVCLVFMPTTEAKADYNENLVAYVLDENEWILPEIGDDNSEKYKSEMYDLPGGGYAIVDVYIRDSYYNPEECMGYSSAISVSVTTSCDCDISIDCYGMTDWELGYCLYDQCDQTRYCSTSRVLRGLNTYFICLYGTIVIDDDEGEIIIDVYLER